MTRADPLIFFFRACLLLTALGLGGIGAERATAQTPSATRTGILKSEVYFGLRAAEGKVVDEQAWEQFVAEVLVPRFPAGLTVLAGSGRSGGSPGSLNPTRILVVVQPDDEDAQRRLREVKAEYKKRFGEVGIFHTDQPVRIHSND